MIRGRATLCVVLALTTAGCAEQLPTAASRAGTSTPIGSGGTLHTGWIIGRNGAPREVTYIEQGDYAVLEGDVIIGRAGEIAKTRADLEKRVDEGLRLGVIIDGAFRRWPGYVAYEIDPTLPDKQRVTAAIALVELQNVGVFFYPRSGQSDYIRFTNPAPANICNSYVGRQGGMQPINIGVGCGAGEGAHEILHALGMWHEQSRCDRDGYVEILWGNIKPDAAFNFEIECADATDVGSYSEGSIMHYGRFDFSIAWGQLPTIRSRRGLDYLMGNRSALNASDVSTLRSMYVVDGLLRCKGVYPGGPCIVRPVDERLSIIEPGGPYVGTEGTDVQFSAGSGAEGMSYVWNFGDNIISTEPTVNHKYADNGDYTVLLTLTNTLTGENTTKTTTAAIANANPAATFTAPPAALTGASFTLSLTSPVDAEADTAGLTYSFDCGEGYGAFSATNTTSCSAPANAGARTVRGKIRDKDSGETAYNATVTIQSPQQTLVFTSLPPNPGIVGDTYNVAAQGGASGNPVTFSSLTSTICSVSGSSVAFLRIGTCNVAANQAGGGGYFAASQISQAINVMGIQTVTFTSTPPDPALVGKTYSLTATKGASGNPVVFSSKTVGVCTVGGTKAKLIAAGVCIIDANQAAGKGYIAAPEVVQSFNVFIAQVVKITSHAPAGAAVGGSYGLTASGGASGNPIVFSSLTPANCSVTSGVAQFLASGTCTVAADQAGTTIYAPAAQVTQNVKIR